MSTLSVRRPLALLAVLGMVATLLFAVAGTASAATATPSSLATFSACPDNAGIPDGGFVDVPPGSFFNDSVSCLKYYTVTTGTTPTEYSPAADVTRAQMALFLARSAGAAGVVLKASPPDAGFTDISELSDEAQLAINQLADAGIVKGKTATTYAPADTVWRQQMALFLARFLDKAVHGPGSSGPPATTGAPFTDIGNTTVEASKAINQMWDAGVATGTTATTFDPTGNVNRGQMALFLTRAFAQANTRPAGINIQAAPTSGNDIVPSAGGLSYDVAVTSRTADFMPVANTIVDQWNFDSWKGAALSTPFNTDGTCNIAGDTDGQITQPVGGGFPCELEVADIVMDGDGNYEYSNGIGVGYTVDLYAWTGASGAKFDVDTTAYSMVTVTPDAVADGFTFTLDPTSGLLKFGDTATWTIQVTNGGKAFAEVGWTFTLGRYTENKDGVTITDPFTTLTTDANGTATYTATYADPSSTGDDLQLEAVWITDSFFGDTFALEAYWDDEPAGVAKVTVSTPTEYKVVEVDGSTANSVTALVLDQYGNPMSGEAVDLSSDQEDGLDTGNTVTTGSTGKASLGYQWNSLDDAKETITANASGLVGTADFYWVYEAETGDTVNGIVPALVARIGGNILVKDLPNKSFVAIDDADSDYQVWIWKAGDTFRIDGELVTQAEFETAFATTEAVDIAVISYSTTGFSEFDLYLMGDR